MALGWWTIEGVKWNTILARDEFGPGTLDGIAADGNSFDGCSAASAENGRAAYEKRVPTYTNMGAIRKQMIEAGRWVMPAAVSNPRTGGATIANVRDELEALGYEIVAFHDEGQGRLSAQDLRNALEPKCVVTLMPFDAEVLQHNEQGVKRHFVDLAAYAGDKDATGDNAPPFDEHGWGMVLVINSDVAGQHGVASGQWMSLDGVAAADIEGLVAWRPKAPVPPAPKPGITIEKDASGNVTGAHDNLVPALRLGPGFALAAEQNVLLGDDITLGETYLSFERGESIGHATIGHRYLMTWTKTAGVILKDWAEAAQIVEALHHA